eukprot:1925923-Prymnesium_polylepis.1
MTWEGSASGGHAIGGSRTMAALTIIRRRRRRQPPSHSRIAGCPQDGPPVAPATAGLAYRTTPPPAAQALARHTTAATT